MKIGGIAYAIYNNGVGQITIKGGNLNASGTGASNTYGIFNKSDGIIVIEKGTIISSCQNYGYGVYNGGAGVINIGIKGDEFTSQEEPNIKGETTSSYRGYALYNSSLGTVNFYDGIIQEGKRSEVLSGNISEIESGYKIVESTINGDNAIYLEKNTEQDYIAQIDNIKYETLQEAIESIPEEEQKTIIILKDFELTESINFNRKIILDLNGKIITNNYFKIENIGDLLITDSTSERKGTIKTSSSLGILNTEGGLEIAGGNINCEAATSSTYGIYNQEGTVKITGGNVNSSNTNYNSTYGIYNKNGTIEITDGSVNSKNAHSYGIYNSSGVLEVKGGNITSSSNTSNYASYGVYNYGTINIMDGNISVVSKNRSYSSSGIYNASSTSTITMLGGSVVADFSQWYDYSNAGIYNNGILTIIDGSVSCTNTSTALVYSILNGKTATITGGSITNSSNGDGQAIKNSGTLTIGTKGDGDVSQEKPSIKAEHTGTSTDYTSYGIYNTTGKLYFYDGIIQGSTKALEDTITEYEDNTELNWQENDTILTLSTILTDVAQIGDVTYSTLEEAISAVGSSQATIKLLRNIMYQNTEETKTIPSDKNIILDLNGYKVTSTIENGIIENNGILEIIDTSEEKTGTLISTTEKVIKNNSSGILTISGGTIENRVNTAIENEGTLKIQDGIIECSYSNENINSKYAVYNNGNIEILGGTVSSTGIYSIYNNDVNTINVIQGTVTGGIYNNTTGTINILGGTINGKGYGIHNNDAGIINVSGGTVSAGNGYYSNRYAIYNNGIGIVNIGVKDGIISNASPIIRADYQTSTSYASCGVYNQSGTLNFYDGKLQGEVRGISGNITDIEDMAEIVVTTETISNNDYETITLQTKTSNVVSLNGVEYDSIEEAIRAAGTTESTIQILRDSDPGATIIIEEGQNITLDLNGFTTINYTELQNNGTLKITDTSTGQNGKITGLIGTAIKNAGTLELNGGAVSDTGYAINNTGTVNITGGKLTGNTYGVYNSNSNAIINMTDGEISSNTYGLYNYNSGTINVNGGTITSNTYGIYSPSGTTNISSTGISANDYGVYNAGGTVNVKEGTTISSNIGIYNTKGTVNIGEKGGVNDETPVIIGEEYGLVNQATVNMYDGQIRGKTGSTQGYVTNTETGYEVETIVDGEYMVDHLALSGTVSEVAEVNGISFSNLQSAINSAIGEEAVTVKLKNGITGSQTFTIAEGQNIILDMNEKTIASDQPVTIINNGTLTIIDSTLSGVGKISSTTGVAIENNGTLALGEDDGTVRQDLITIEGETNGIVTSGTLNFYDGTINGASAVSGTVTARPDGYVIRTTTVNGKERYYLSAS